jgi:hypothetical protein
MPEIILHFDAGADAEKLAKALQEHAITLPGVEVAEADAYPSRGMEEIILTLTLATTVLQNGATTLDALKRFIESCKGVAGALGLGHPRVEVGMQQIEPEALTAEHAKQVQSG